MFQRIGSKSGQARELMYITSLYNILGQKGDGLRNSLKALALFEQAKDAPGVIDALQWVAFFYEQADDHAHYLSSMRRLVALLQQPASGPDSYGNRKLLADTHIQLHEYEKARDIWLQMLAEEEQRGLTAFIPGTLGSLGDAERSLGNTDRALEYYSCELKLIENNRNPVDRALLLHEIADIEDVRGRPNIAEQKLEEAVGLLEKVRNSFGGLTEIKSTFLASRIRTYHLYIKLLLDASKTEQAFAVVRRLRRARCWTS